MNAAIKTLANVNANKRIAVLGDMLELGDFSKKAHADVGKMVADNNIDYLLAYGNDAKYIVDGAKQNGMKNAFYFDNNFQTNFLSLHTRVTQLYLKRQEV